MVHKFYFLFLLIPFICLGQKMPETVSNNRVILNNKDSIIYAYLLPSEKDEHIKAKNEYFYCWYASHDIKQTQGGFDGRLLDGLYTEFYEGKELKTKGTFSKGLRKGEWKCWYFNGNLSSIIHYKKSLKHGKFTEYNQDGVIIRKGKYRKGILVKEKEKKIKVKKEKAVQDTLTLVDKSKKIRKKDRSRVDSTISTPDQNTLQPDNTEEVPKGKKKRRDKEPQIKIRRGIRVYPQQPGKST